MINSFNKPILVFLLHHNDHVYIFLRAITWWFICVMAQVPEMCLHLHPLPQDTKINKKKKKIPATFWSSVSSLGLLCKSCHGVLLPSEWLTSPLWSADNPANIMQQFVCTSLSSYIPNPLKAAGAMSRWVCTACELILRVLACCLRSQYTTLEWLNGHSCTAWGCC